MGSASRRVSVEKFCLAPRAGFEPTTLQLTAACSTIELPGNKAAEPGFEPGLRDPKSPVLPLHNSALNTPQFGAEGRARTGTGVTPQQFLRLPRLPIPPLRLFQTDDSKTEAFCAEARNRTADTRIFSPLLYQLSYLGVYRNFSPSPLCCQVKGYCSP